MHLFYTAWCSTDLKTYRRVILAALIGCMLLSLFACHKALSPVSVVEQNKLQRPHDSLDTYIRQEFTDPYGIEVVYNWERNYTSDKHSYPPEFKPARAVLETIKELWLKLYTLSNVGGSGFMKGKNPLRIRLYGGQNMREVGQGNDNLVELVDGSTESPVELAVYNVNNFSITNEDQVFGLMQSVHHQFVKRLFDLAAFDKQKFIQISGADQYAIDLKELQAYNAVRGTGKTREGLSRKEVFGLNDAANKEGFFTSQARLSPEHDLAETIAIMLTMSSTDITKALSTARNNPNAITKDLQANFRYSNDDNLDFAQARENDYQGEKAGRTAYTVLSQKRQFAIDYLQQHFGLPLVRMQLLAAERTRKWIDLHKKPAR